MGDNVIQFPDRTETTNAIGEAKELLQSHPLKGGGGGGTFDGMEARVAKLEAAFETVAKDIRDIKDDVRELRRDMRGDIGEMRRDARSDFRVLFGAVIAVALGLAGLMAKGFHWL